MIIFSSFKTSWPAACKKLRCVDREFFKKTPGWCTIIQCRLVSGYRLTRHPTIIKYQRHSGRTASNHRLFLYLLVSRGRACLRQPNSVIFDGPFALFWTEVTCRWNLCSSLLVRSCHSINHSGLEKRRICAVLLRPQWFLFWRVFLICCWNWARKYYNIVVQKNHWRSWCRKVVLLNPFPQFERR